MTRSTAIPEEGARFGIITAPQQVDYLGLLRVWREADTVPEIEQAWLFDHLMPIGRDPLGPTHEGWTLLSALAAQTGRPRLGLRVTSSRPPAMLAQPARTELKHAPAPSTP
jgi:alkanesulfonate monooxygenase SsuD/methylene tetrahydromethanopterin reductase-like flavin-dependent oxidoreductase (luciferase family)